MESWQTWLAGTFLAAFSALFGYLLKRQPLQAQARLESHAQIISEYVDLTNRLQKQVNDLLAEVVQLRIEHGRCLADNTRMEKTVSELQAQMEFIHAKDVDPTAMCADVVCDASGRITDWDLVASLIFGWRKSEALGRPVTTLMPDPFIGKHLTAFQTVMDSEEKRPRHGIIRAVARSKAGEEFPVAIVLSSWRTAANEPRFGASIRRRTADLPPKDTSIEK